MKTGALNCAQATTSDCSESSQNSQEKSNVSTLRMHEMNQTCEKRTNTEKTCKFLEQCQDSRQLTSARRNDVKQNSVCATENSDSLEYSRNSQTQEWCDIAEVVDSDFLISPGDIYPNRKVELEDAEIKDSTRDKFELLCDQQSEAFSKNNKDIGRTQLIEMEIDMGDSLPVAQSPYTLPLKHYDWVHQEIETLEKSGVIERSLSRWASPVIVVPKKSAPDEPPRRRLCVDYRKVNALQPEVKRTDKSTGCLLLYPLPKIDEIVALLANKPM